MKILRYLNLFFVALIFNFCSDNYSTEIRDSIIKEFSTNQNVEYVNHYYDTEDWENVMDFDVVLKNNIHMYIAGCQYDENRDLVYDSVYHINDWFLLEIIHYEVEDKYVIMSAERKENELMGKSLKYLLNNYQELCDLYMNAPEFDSTLYTNLKETFEKVPNKCMYDIYDENGRKIGVSKLYRRREKIGIIPLQTSR